MTLFPRGMNKRWWLFRPIDLITALFKSRKPKQGMVIVRMDGLGDMILFRPTLDYYAKAFAVDKKDITILGCHSWRALAATIFKDYNVVTINEHAYERKFFYRLKISVWMARQHFKIATCDIYFRKPMTCDSLLYYSYADRIAVCAPHPSKKTKPRFDYYRQFYTDIIDTGLHPTHETLRHYRFISAIIGNNIKPKPLLIPWRKDKDPINLKPYIAINFGSNEAGRRWPFDGYIELAKRIANSGYYVLFLGGPAERDYSQLLDKHIAHPKIINYIGKDKGLMDLFDILQHAAGVITSETGPGHFALALQVPTLMICGGAAYNTFVPYPKEISKDTMQFIYHKLDCFTCLENCPYRQDDTQAYPCLNRVTVDHVWETFKTRYCKTATTTL